MKANTGPRTLSLSLILASLIGAAPGPVRSNPDESAIIQQELVWSKAFLAHDINKIAEILSDDFVGIDGRGMVSNKANELAEAAPPRTGDNSPRLVGEEYSD